MIELLSVNADNVPFPYYLGFIFATGVTGKGIDEETAAASFSRMIEIDIRNSNKLSSTLDASVAGRRIQFEYSDKDGNPLNFTKVIEYLRDATSRGIAKAQCALGMAHWYGWRGVQQDQRLAVQLFERASAQDEPRATEILSLISADNLEASAALKAPRPTPV